MITRRDVFGVTAGATAGAALCVRLAARVSDGQTPHEDPAHLFERD